jgi:S1-C subfamily serine protease
MKSPLKSVALVALVLFVNSCASTFNGKYQKVNLSTKNRSSQVFVNDEKQTKGQTPTIRLPRNGRVQQLRIETEGYKDIYMVAGQTKKSPLVFVSLVPLIYPILLDNGVKSYDYKKNQTVDQVLIPIPEKSEDEKFLFVEKTTFNIAEQDLKFTKIALRSYKKNKKSKFQEIQSNTEEIAFDNSIFTQSLNNILLDYGYSDSTNTIFKSKTSSAYLNASIKKMDLQHVVSGSFNYLDFYKVVVDIEWELLDFYGQSVYGKEFQSSSGDFSAHFYGEELGKVAIEDAIATSFLNFVNDPEVKQRLKKDSKSSSPQFEQITLAKGKIVEGLDEAIQSTVTVEVKDGHGSGFLVSRDGYLLTNFHVVARSKDDITVITNDSKRLKARLVRHNEDLDLALIKVDAVFEKHFELPTTPNYRTGQDVFVVGTPQSVELGQTITKGIISGYRDREKVKLIQTDASINGGNSGGPLISTEGILIGIVNAKFSGVGVEGIGFAIPALSVMDALSIKQ